MRIIRRLLSGFRFSLLFVGAIMGCNQPEISDRTDSADQLLARVDSTVQPQNNIYWFANGNWLSANDGGRTGLEELENRNNRQLAQLLTQVGLSDELELDDDRKKAADFFLIGIDTVRVRELGSRPLEPFLKEIDQIRKVNDLTDYLAHKESYRLGSFFTLSMEKTSSDRNNYVVLSPSGFGLPVDYYSRIETDSSLAYIRLIRKMLDRAGVNSQDSAEYHVYAIESQLIETIPVVSQPVDSSQIMGIDALESWAPSIDWAKYFGLLNLGEVEHVLVRDSAWFKKFNRIIDETPVAVIRDYLRWNLINEMAPFLSQEFARPHRDFYRNYVSADGTEYPRWQEVLEVVNYYMGGAVGQIYVENEFPPDAHKEATAMVNNIRLSLVEGIKEFSWLSDSAKIEALEQLRRMDVIVGRPTNWPDYSEFILDRGTELGSYMQNVMNGRRFEFERMMQYSSMSEPRVVPGLLPQEVRIEYFPQENTLVVTAAVLQFPLFNYQGDRPLNYGGIGTLIGSEMSKVFLGNSACIATDSVNFDNFREMIRDQYIRSVGEDSADGLGNFNSDNYLNDLVGLEASLEGYKRYARNVGIDSKDNSSKIDLQRFFISWARVMKSKEQETVNRVNNVLSNVPEFQEVFGLSAGDSLYRPDSLMVKIW